LFFTSQFTLRAFPPLYNDEELAKFGIGLAEGMFGKESAKLLDSGHMMGCEDFSFVAEEVGGTFFGLVRTPVGRCRWGATARTGSQQFWPRVFSIY